MPFIRLKQSRGEYVFQGVSYKAGENITVSDKEAYYLVHQEQVAFSVAEKDILQEAEQKAINKGFADNYENKLKIAMMRLGGIGDTFLLSCHARAVKRRYPNSHITLYIRDQFDPIADFEAVDRTVVTGGAVWTDVLSEIIAKQFFDIVYDNRYVTKVYYTNKKMKDDQAYADKHFAPFKELYDGWIQSNSKLKDLKISTFDLFYKSTGLEGGEEDIKFPLSREHYKFAQLLQGQKYVTIHNGSDLSRQTKCWATKHWEVLTKELQKRGYKVIQLGKQYEEEVKGAMNLCGMTTFFETGALLARADFHVDSEGGLVHLAKGVGTRCIVLFGPTALSCFGYDQNINIVSELPCIGCWWTTEFWWRDCPEGFPTTPPCMEKIMPDKVLKAVDEIEKMPKIEKVSGEEKYDPNNVNEKFAMELTLDEAHYKAEQHQWERVNIMMDEVKGKKVLEVGAGDGYCSLVLKKRGFDVTSTEISEIRLERMRRAGLSPVKADICALPFPDESFDSVICGEVLEHIPNWWEGMKELERVCKKDGKLILSWPVHPDYDGIKMHLWGIRFFPVYRNKQLDFSIQTMQRINRDGA